MAKKARNVEQRASNVERTVVNGREVWHVHSATTGRVLSVTTKSSTAKALDRADSKYAKALKSLANR